MSDVINLTITDQVDVFNITMTEEAPILVSFYDIALPDPKVAEAKDVAVASQVGAEAALAATLEAQAAAEAAVASISPLITAEVSAQLAANPTVKDENSAGYIYLKGDVITDNSWRFSVSVDNKLSLEIRLAGVWTLKGRWNP